ncbi:hypothetical protein ACFLQR_03090 [Verrucomicrobiota bacterium]
MISKIISLLMAIVFVTTMFFADGAEDAWKVGIGMIFILALVWYGDEMGSFVGGAAPLKTATTPRWMLRGFGWIVLIGAFVVSIFQILDMVKD